MEPADLLQRVARVELKAQHLARSRFAGLYRSAFRGQGMEFAEVREYAEGDDVRLIDWNVSARSQSLYIKRMVEERERNVLVVLDVSGSLNFGSIRRTKFDLMVEVAAVFVLAAFNARDRASLALARSQVELYVPPGKGWNHAARLIRHMAAARPAGLSRDLEAVWKFLNAPGVPRSLVIFLTDFQAPLQASNSFAVVCRKHELVVALASDRREWELPRIGRIWLRNPEDGGVFLCDTNRDDLRRGYEKDAQERRERLIRLLRNQGVDWVEFDTASDYVVPLRRFLAERSARRGYRRQ